MHSAQETIFSSYTECFVAYWWEPSSDQVRVVEHLLYCECCKGGGQGQASTINSPAFPLRNTLYLTCYIILFSLTCLPPFPIWSLDGILIVHNIIPGLLQKIVATFTALLNFMQYKDSCAVYSCHTSFPTHLLVLPFSLNYGEKVVPYLCWTHYAHGTMEAIQIKGMACILSAGRCVIAILLQCFAGLSRWHQWWVLASQVVQNRNDCS